MTPKEETRIRIAIRDKVMHFSPTISPAPKNEERNEIESISSALDFYAEAGVKKVIIQPKYMGSYCDIYLHKDIEKTRFYSRRGYSISDRQISKAALIEAVKPLHERFSWEGVELRLIQAELLPWAALGKGLIIREFGGYEVCHQSHCDYLKSSSLVPAIKKLMATDEFQAFLKDSATLSRKEVKAKYSDYAFRQYEALRFLQIPEPNAYQEAIALYSQQLELYGDDDGSLEFKPFNLLKTVYDDELEEICESNIEGFRAVSDDAHMLIDLDNEPPSDPRYKNFGEEIAYTFFNTLTVENMEGIVIKPDHIWDKESVPMFKVRNNNYLQMIYGVRFQSDYDYYLRRRRIGKKMRCSRNEWNIAQTLLRIPMSEISSKNEEYCTLVKKRILEEDFEATLDSRL